MLVALSLTKTSLSNAELLLDQMISDYKDEALTKYEETKDTEPMPFIKIKMYTTLDYDANDAIKHVIDINQLRMLELDKTKFEKYVKSLDADIDMKIEVSQEPRPTLSKKIFEEENK